MAGEELTLGRLLPHEIIEDIRSDPDASREIIAQMKQIVEMCRSGRGGAELDVGLMKLGGLVNKHTGFNPALTPEIRAKLARRVLLAVKRQGTRELPKGKQRPLRKRLGPPRG